MRLAQIGRIEHAFEGNAVVDVPVPHQLAAVEHTDIGLIRLFAINRTIRPESSYLVIEQHGREVLRIDQHHVHLGPMGAKALQPDLDIGGEASTWYASL